MRIEVDKQTSFATQFGVNNNIKDGFKEVMNNKTGKKNNI